MGSNDPNTTVLGTADAIRSNLAQRKRVALSKLSDLNAKVEARMQTDPRLREEVPAHFFSATNEYVPTMDAQSVNFQKVGQNIGLSADDIKSASVTRQKLNAFRRDVLHHDELIAPATPMVKKSSASLVEV